MPRRFEPNSVCPRTLVGVRWLSCSARWYSMRVGDDVAVLESIREQSNAFVRGSAPNQVAQRRVAHKTASRAVAYKTAPRRVAHRTA